MPTNNPLSQVRPWVWGPRDGVGIIQTDDGSGGYWLIDAPEPQGASQQYLYQYGFPLSAEPQIVSASPELEELVNQAINQTEWPDEMNYEENVGLTGSPDRKLATQYNLNRAEVGLLKFWSIVTGKPAPKIDSENIGDLLDDLADDRVFGRAVDEIGRSDMKFVWQFLGLLPVNAKRQAIWRVAVVNSPSKPGAYGVDSRQALLVKMYLIANPKTPTPSKVKHIDSEQLVAGIANNPDKFILVANRLIKSVGFPQGMLLMLSDLQRVRLVREYLRLHAEEYIDGQYF